LHELKQLKKDRRQQPPAPPPDYMMPEGAENQPVSCVPATPTPVSEPSRPPQRIAITIFVPPITHNPSPLMSQLRFNCQGRTGLPACPATIV
jgi:hypothetical protein